MPRGGTHISPLEKRLRKFRSIRLRLTFSFIVLFGLLLTGIGIAFRYGLERILNDWIDELIVEDWNAARGFLRIERGQAIWTVDPREVDQTVFVERLRRVVLVADMQGRILEASNQYRLFGMEKPSEIVAYFHGPPAFTKLREQGGDRALVRYGVFRSGGEPYLLAVGRRITDLAVIPDRFAGYYFTLLPAFLLLTGALGWFLARRALHPFEDLAEAAERISGSSLHLRIPDRGADDELGRLVGAFNTMMARLSDNFEQIRRFSTDVSHELRTPLTAIRGQLEVALMTASNEEQYREAIFNALQDVDRVSNIARALLLLSQAETGQIVLNRKRMDLSAVVSELTEQFGTLAADKQLRLTRRVVRGAYILADSTQMERLVSNLLSNAVKYTQEGGEIVVGVEPSSSGVTLTVSDTGKGIPAQSVPHIFDRFYRVPGKHTEEGLGLGLSFVAWIVKAHDASIDVDSTVGVGTTFRIQFPPAPVEVPAGEAAVEPAEEARQ